MKPIFDPMELELSTEKERDIFEKIDKKINGYLDGKIDAMELRNLAGSMSYYGKKIQSRSAMAMIKYDMQKRSDKPKQISRD